MNERTGREAGSVVSREKGRRKRSRPPSPWPRYLLLGLFSALIVGAPLACGAVHRPTLLVALVLAGCLGIGATFLLRPACLSLQILVPMSIPLLLVLIPLLQSIPLPLGIRALLDPRGTELLSLAPMQGPFPLSLDPPATYLKLAKAAMALAVSLAAFTLASGRRWRQAPATLVALAGILALLVGLSHRAIGLDSIYGMLATNGGLPIGPFVNPNHLAEFFELSAFAAFAFAQGATTRDRRRGGYILAAVLAAGALSTLSRGSVLALGAGSLVLLIATPSEGTEYPRRRNRFAILLLGLVLVSGFTLALKGERILAELQGTQLGSDMKLQIWWDSLRILPEHLVGIGLGAFERVYPIHQTLSIPALVEFPENILVGLIVEAGIPGMVLLVFAALLTVLHFRKHRRADGVEAALVASIVAVLAHNLVDFGFEAPGVLLPFSALWGALFGRQIAGDGEVLPSRRASLPLGLTATAAVVGGLVLFFQSRDFDALLHQPGSPPTLALAREASVAHPVDSYYALAMAQLETGQDNASIKRRLGQLNRAMRLCPTCSEPHRFTGRLLWHLGRRPQALAEFRMLGKLTSLSGAFTELVSLNARPDELASLETEENRIELCHYLLQRGHHQEVQAILQKMGNVPGIEDELLAGHLALATRDLKTAQAMGKSALAQAPRDPRAHQLAAEHALRSGETEKALEMVNEGLRHAPANIELNRRALALLAPTENFEAISRAISNLRAALVEAGIAPTETHIAAGSLWTRRGQLRKAISEYQAALTQNPNDIGLRLLLARTAEENGSVTVASDAYREVLRRDPQNAEAQAAFSRTTKDKKMLEAILAQPPSKTLEDLR